MQLFQGTFVHSPSLGELLILPDHLVAVDATGTIVHSSPSQTPESLALLSQHAESPQTTTLTKIPEGSFLLPTFCDLHLHAPQFLYQGNGLDLPLMQWLDRYALKAEALVDSDLGLAERVYTRLAQRLKENGTGSVLLFGTIKEETNLVLARCMQDAGIRAFVGKLSMDIDISTPDAKNPLYVEPSASASLAAARSFIERCRALANVYTATTDTNTNTNNDNTNLPTAQGGSSVDASAIVVGAGAMSANENSNNQHHSATATHVAPLVRPVLTPRFVPTCTNELLVGLAELSKLSSEDKEEEDEAGLGVSSGSERTSGSHGLLRVRSTRRPASPVRIQSHMAEAKDQIDWVRGERGKEDIDVFDDAGLLTNHTIQAHCTFLSVPTDLTRCAQRGTAIAHCPLSNVYFSSGKPFALREALDAGVKVGLGTDVAGGYSVDIMNAMREAVGVSRMREGERGLKLGGGGVVGSERSLAIDWKESVYLATKGGMGGLNLVGGDFAVGALFDAQEISLFDPNSGRGVGSLDFFELEILKERQRQREHGSLLGAGITAVAGDHDSSRLEDVNSNGITLDMVEKWWCVGDTRNRKNVWVQGRRVFSSSTAC